MWICFERKKAKVGQNSSCFSSGMHNFGLVSLLRREPRELWLERDETCSFATCLLAL